MNILRIYLAVTLSFLGGTRIWSQTVINGSIMYKEGSQGTDSMQHVDAYVTIKEQGNTVVAAFGDIDENGRYILKINSEADSLVITVNGMSFSKSSKVVANQSQQVDFYIEEAPISLKEVSVSAPKIQLTGDTLNYSVASYMGQEDRTIGDVLKKMPGIEMSESGSIKYNGKSISEFYVENMNLLQGRYGIATNNILAEDVATVQVMENHQSIKSLQGKQLTDNVAINLKLRDNAKGTFAINAMAGGGFGNGILWTPELVAMFFGRKRQNISLYKGNNAGDDISSELKSQFEEEGITLVPLCPTGIVMPEQPDIPLKKYWNNRSQILSINHLERTDEDTDLSINISYYNDDIRHMGESMNNYFVTNSERLMMQQSMTATSHFHNLVTTARYCRNTSNGFMANILNLTSNWNKDKSDILLSTNTGYSSTISQHFNRPELSIRNTVNFIKNIGNNSWNMHLSAGYAESPKTLTASIAPSAFYSQEVMSRHIATQANTSYTLRFGNLGLNYGVIGYMSLHNIKTDLEGWQGSPNLNDIWYNVYEISFGQEYMYKLPNWNVVFSLPLTMSSRTLDDRIAISKHHCTHLLAIPNLRITYKRRNFSAITNMTYYKQIGDVETLYRDYVMTNYYSFQRSYLQQMAERENTNFLLTLRYRSALHALFANLTGGYVRRHYNMTYGKIYNGMTSTTYALQEPTASNSYNLSSEISKGYDFWQTSMRFWGSYNYQESECLVQEQHVNICCRTLAFGIGSTITPIRWLNLVYSGGFRKYWNNEVKSSADATFHNSTHRLSLNFFPQKNLIFMLSVEETYSNHVNKHHVWFGDIHIKYKLKLIDLEMECNNVFNQHTYARVVYNNLDILQSMWELRPMNIMLKVRFKLL